MNRRVFFSDNGTLSDYSSQLSKISNNSALTGAITTDDAIFIGSDLPFNSIYFNVLVANSNSSTVSISYWDGSEFVAARDIQDGTSGFSTSGKIEFAPNNDYMWAIDDTELMTDSGISSLFIREKYWIKLVLSANASDTTSINYAGYMFSNDSDLGSEYPELDRMIVKDAFKKNKTDWNEQSIRASEYIINDLKYDRVIVDKSQILRTEDLINSCCHRVAQIVFSGMGKDYEDRVRMAESNYTLALDRSFPVIDKSKDAIVDNEDKTGTGFQMRLYR